MLEDDEQASHQSLVEVVEHSRASIAAATQALQSAPASPAPGRRRRRGCSTTIPEEPSGDLPKDPDAPGTGASAPRQVGESHSASSSADRCGLVPASRSCQQRLLADHRGELQRRLGGGAEQFDARPSRAATGCTGVWSVSGRQGRDGQAQRVPERQARRESTRNAHALLAGTAGCRRSPRTAAAWARAVQARGQSRTVEKLHRAGALEGVDARLRVVRPAAPGVPVVRSIVSPSSGMRRVGGLSTRLSSNALGLAVEPVQVFKRHDERGWRWLSRTSSALMSSRCAGAARGRSPAPSRATVLNQQIQQSEQSSRIGFSASSSHSTFPSALSGAPPSIVDGRPAGVALRADQRQTPRSWPRPDDTEVSPPAPARGGPARARELVEQTATCPTPGSPTRATISPWPAAASSARARSSAVVSLARPTRNSIEPRMSRRGLDPGAPWPDPHEIEGLDGL